MLFSQRFVSCTTQGLLMSRLATTTAAISKAASALSLFGGLNVKWTAAYIMSQAKFATTAVVRALN